VTHVKPLRIRAGADPLRIPADKSITHRAFLFSLLSPATSRISDPLLGADCVSSLDAVRTLGAEVLRKGESVEIRGFGLRPFRPKSDQDPLVIDCGNSGTTIRLLCGILSGQNARYRLIGDESLSRRPMARVSDPLGKMGASVEPKGRHGEKRTPPVEISEAAEGLWGMSHKLSIASAQVKSALLLAGLWCAPKETTTVIEPDLSRDHTERMLRGMGAEVTSAAEAGKGWAASIHGMKGGELAPVTIAVPGDPSSAAFWACAAVMQGARVRLENVLLNPTRLGFARVLKRMGAAIHETREREECGEDVGSLKVGPGTLAGTEVSGHEIPSLIDEIPVLAVTALWARGTTIFRGVQELRVKESDRLEAIVKLIKEIGGAARIEGDDLFVEGLGHEPKGPSEGLWSYQTLGDHRLAMTAVVAADALRREIVLDDAECIKVSYPGFFTHREALSQ
jgi:3-phosphoshikimate 1-carboxyvinyltransferase